MSDGDQTRFAQMHNSYSSTAYWLWLANEIGVLQLDTDVVSNAVAANIHRYPGISKISASKRLWGAEGSKFDAIAVGRFSAAIQTRLAELKKIEPEPLPDPDWCGNFS